MLRAAPGYLDFDPTYIWLPVVTGDNNGSVDTCDLRQLHTLDCEWTQPPNNSALDTERCFNMSKSRYLTAPKICLLLLVKLYCQSDLATSAIVPLLSFVLSHTSTTISSAARTPGAVEQEGISLSIWSFQDLLQKHASTMPGRTLFDDAIREMWQIGSIDSLFRLLDSLGSLLVSSQDEVREDEARPVIRLSATSPLGTFVRRARVEFSRLPFDDIVHLWCAFVAYRAPTAPWTKRSTGLISSNVDHVATEMGLAQEDTLVHIACGRLVEKVNSSYSLSMNDLERTLEFQLDKLQR